jgi:hypothetical protein
MVICFDILQDRRHASIFSSAVSFLLAPALRFAEPSDGICDGRRSFAFCSHGFHDGTFDKFILLPLASRVIFLRAALFFSDFHAFLRETVMLIALSTLPCGFLRYSSPSPLRRAREVGRENDDMLAESSLFSRLPQLLRLFSPPFQRRNEYLNAAGSYLRFIFQSVRPPEAQPSEFRRQPGHRVTPDIYLRLPR